METFLEEVSKVYENIIQKPNYYSVLKVVLGNESCDLDSAISALVYGFFLHHEVIQNGLEKTAVLPLLNVPLEDLSLKTEVAYFLKQNNISVHSLPTRGFRNLLDLVKVQEAGALELILVDHHVLAESDSMLKPSVKTVIDHRPQDPEWLWENSQDVSIELVGSCCSLVAKKIMTSSPYLLTEQIAKLLLGPIILDTVNLSPEAGRATPLDEEMVKALEQIVSIDRKKLLEDLVREKASISSLTTSQILRKDLKTIGGVPMAGVPILVHNLCQRKDFEKSVQGFIRDRHVTAMIVFGVQVANEDVSRDIAIISAQPSISDVILESLLQSTSPSLGLVEIVDHNVENMRLFKQSNVKATRKHIAPILKKVALPNGEISTCP